MNRCLREHQVLTKIYLHWMPNVSTMIEIFDGAIGLSNDNKCLMQNCGHPATGFMIGQIFATNLKLEQNSSSGKWVSDSVIAESEYGHISAWDVSLINNMSNLFFNKSTFNSDLSNWDVSNVTDMSYMFKSSAFNGDISDWNTSSVTNMNSMFSENVVFDGDLSSWDVSSVVDMTAMFRMTNFYGDLSAWNTSNVTSMTMMFDQSDFDSDISSWDVSSVTSFREMFRGSPFNHDLSNWDVSSGTNFATMFTSSNISESNKCAIHTSFFINDAWPYDWSIYCNEPPMVQGMVIS